MTLGSYCCNQGAHNSRFNKIKERLLLKLLIIKGSLSMLCYDIEGNLILYWHKINGNILLMVDK